MTAEVRGGNDSDLDEQHFDMVGGIQKGLSMVAISFQQAFHSVDALY